jgi:phosphoribosylaminoimidazole-succinocarboxamide synthase
MSTSAPPPIAVADAFVECDLPLADRRDGKVRASFALPDDRRLFVTTDRLSAFDRVLAGVPYKGQVLNQLAAHWFATTRHIVANHLLSVPDPNATIGITATPLPVEVVVRGHITGVTSTSLWRQYAEGARTIYGYDLPGGLRKNTELPRPIVTPTTKGALPDAEPSGDAAGAAAGHDIPITCAQVVDLGLVDAVLWEQVQAAALALFDHGRRVAADAGLILADTKFEFGTTPDGTLLLIDEALTPDSSRYWEAGSYERRLAENEEPESLDKEPVRRALHALGYAGDGDPPALPISVWNDTTVRYVHAFERLTGTTFHPGDYPVAPRLLTNLRREGIV